MFVSWLFHIHQPHWLLIADDYTMFIINTSCYSLSKLCMDETIIDEGNNK